MSITRNQTVAKALEQYRVTFENVKLQPEIASIMAEFGYDETALAAGKALLTNAQTAYNNNQTKDNESIAAYNNFVAAKAQLASVYSLHRKKGKVVFRKDENALTHLGLKGSIPQAYLKWLEKVKLFYTVSLASADMQLKLERLKITPQEITDALNQITTIEAARAAYVKEKGESQDATKIKEKAFVAINQWMIEFYAVAKIALINNQQLLESLGKFVRS